MALPIAYRQDRRRTRQGWWLKPSPLTGLELSVAREMLIDLDPAGVAQRLRLSEQRVRDILGKSVVQAMFHALQGARSLRTAVYGDEILRCWELARRSDTNEIVQVRVGCCRHCWGEGHAYQRTVGEMERDLLQHEKDNARRSESKQKIFDPMGGDGFDRRREPNPGCPECAGEGAPRVVLMDTTKLSPGARYRYEGAEVRPDGTLKIDIRSRADFDQMVGQHLGLIGKNGRGAERNPEDMADEELDALLARHGVVVDVEFESVEGETGESDLAHSSDPVGE